MPDTPSAPGSQPSRRTTNEFLNQLQQELNRKGPKLYRAGPPVGNPRPVGEFLKGIPKTPPGSGAQPKK